MYINQKVVLEKWQNLVTFESFAKYLKVEVSQKETQVNIQRAGFSFEMLILIGSFIM